LICLYHFLILSFYLPSLHPCPQGTVTERIKNKGKGQKHSGPICLRGIEEMEATSFLLPIIFIWPPDRARECAQETLRSVYGMPRCLLSSGDARCFILQHTHTHSLRHCSILPPNKTIIKQHTCPPGPMKHCTQESLSKRVKLFLHLSWLHSLMDRLAIGLRNMLFAKNKTKTR